MLPPDKDLDDRRPVWDALQMFWMDTDPAIFLETGARVCARSKYSLDEIEQIYWNEVQPAVEFNLKSVAGEWTGFEIEWLVERILKTHHFGRPLPVLPFDRYASAWWEKLRPEIERARMA